MRVIAILVFISFYFCGIAQTDSTEIKLQRYKELHEKGLINDTEYELLKSKELDLMEVPKAKKDTVNLNSLRRTFKTQIIVGSLELAGAVALVGTGFHFRNKVRYKSVSINGVQRAVPDGYYTREARISFVMAAIFGGVGIYSVVKGAKNRHKWIEQLSISPTSASLSIRF